MLIVSASAVYYNTEKISVVFSTNPVSIDSFSYTKCSSFIHICGRFIADNVFISRTLGSGGTAGKTIKNSKTVVFYKFYVILKMN